MAKTTNTSTDNLATNKARFLTKEEELHLGMLIQEHYTAKETLESQKVTPKQRKELEEKVALGVEAVDQLVKANVRLVYDRANKFRSRFPHGPKYEDLVQDGMVGLMTAVRKYDPARGNKFSTVAYHWVDQSISRNTNNTFRLVRLPENRVIELMKTMAISHSEEAEGFSSEEVDELIMEKLKMSRQTLATIRSAGSMPVSLNRPVGSDDSGNRELIDVIATKHTTMTLEEEFVREEASNTLKNAMGRLTETQQAVLNASFSLLPGENVAPSMVKKQYNLTPSKYRTILSEAISLLRKDLTEMDISFSDFTA